MSIARRAAVVLFALVAAHAAAALLITLCMMFEWEEIVRATGVGPGWLALGVFGLITWKALLPAMLVVVLAEGFGIRSILLYAVAGGLGFAGLATGLGVGEREPGGALIGRELEIMAGAGIAAGFIYWAMAGRHAGAWRENRHDAATGE
jgi:hypothetical protein